MKFEKYRILKESHSKWLDKIPEEWGEERMKYICKINPSKNSISVAPDLTVTFLPMEKVSESGSFEQDLNKPFEEVSNGYTFFCDGDVIVAKITPCFENGKGAFLEGLENGMGFGSTEFHVLRPHHKKAIPKFIYYLTTSHLFRSTGKRFMKGVAGQQRVPTEFIENFLVSLPSIDEQKSIVDFLGKSISRIENLKDKYFQFTSFLKEKRTALITHAVTKGLNPDARMKDSGVEWIGEMPEHWEVKRLKFLVQKKLQYGANESGEEYSPELPKYIRITDIDKDGNLRDDDQKSLPVEVAKDYMLETGDILFARSGATVGKTFYYDGLEKACFAGYMIRASILKNKNSRYFYYYTLSSSYDSWLSYIFIKRTIENIGAERYANLVMPLPIQEEQTEIVSYLDKETRKLDTLIAKIKKQIEFLNEYKISLITQAVTGKIDVRGVN